MSDQSSSASSSAQEKIDNKEENQDDPLESLLRQLHGQIKSSDWLQNNSANKLEQENPELIAAWKEAVNK